MGNKPGPRPKPLSQLGPTAKWYRTKATPLQIKKHQNTSDKAGSKPKKIKERSEDNHARKHILKIPVGSHLNAARKKGGGWVAQSDKKNKGANGHGKRSKYSA